MSGRRVVVTGMGGVTPLGNGLDVFWRRLVSGESGIRKIQEFVDKQFPVQIGGECHEFDPLQYIDARRIKRLDRCAQLAVAAAQMAAQDSGIDFAKTDPRRACVILGSGIGGLTTIEEQHLRLIEKGVNRVSAFTTARLMLNAASGHISMDHNVQGPVLSIATACASSNNAIGEAMGYIRRGDIDIAFTGGTEDALSALGISAFAAMKALSLRNDDPPGASRPFDANRDGFVMGEGAGVLVIEELEHAKKRGARIHAELVGYGVSADSYDIVQPHPEGEMAARAISSALRMAQVNPDQVDMISAHGTGTSLGDISETKAIKRVFGPNARQIPITGTKSSIGHLLGAGGGVELIVCIKAIQDGIVPPTLNLNTPDPECDLDYTPLKARELRIDVVVNNSFGFGGHNAVIIARRFE
ncbi:MAG: beta-ketoacyl-ACP synthase II [Phycisphaerae bacterium]|nr:beta-ketoacyl-ACP synthase II [Phycisphaerae bacterium]